MGCDICDDLDQQYLKAITDRRTAEDAVISSTNENERGSALIAVARARRQVIDVWHLIEAHNRQGCLSIVESRRAQVWLSSEVRQSG